MQEVVGSTPIGSIQLTLSGITVYRIGLRRGWAGNRLTRNSYASLVAAVNPANTQYLFYVLSGADGSHAFAVTYDEHQANVRAAKAAGVLP